MKERERATAKAKPAPVKLTGLSGESRETVLSRVSDKLGIPPVGLSQMVEALEQVVQDKGNTDAIVDRYRADKSAMIQLLREIEREKRWLPRDVLMFVWDGRFQTTIA